jgi:hypothetical protein
MKVSVSTFLTFSLENFPFPGNVVKFLLNLMEALKNLPSIFHTKAFKELCFNKNITEFLLFTIVSKTNQNPLIYGFVW